MLAKKELIHLKRLSLAKCRNFNCISFVKLLSLPQLASNSDFRWSSNRDESNIFTDTSKLEAKYCGVYM